MDSGAAYHAGEKCSSPPPSHTQKKTFTRARAHSPNPGGITRCALTSQMFLISLLQVHLVDKAAGLCQRAVAPHPPHSPPSLPPLQAAHLRPSPPSSSLPRTGALSQQQLISPLPPLPQSVFCFQIPKPLLKTRASCPTTTCSAKFSNPHKTQILPAGSSLQQLPPQRKARVMLGGSSE